MKSLNEFLCESFSDNVLKEFMKWVSTLPKTNNINDKFSKRFTVMFGSRDYNFKFIAWDKISGPTERLNLKQDTNEFKAVAKKLNSMKRKSIPELAIGRYKYTETGEYEWFILCSPDRYCVMIDHSSYTNEQVINIELTERNIVEQLNRISTYIGADDTIEVFIYNLSTYDVTNKILGREEAKSGVIYMDDDSLRRYRDKMVEQRERMVRQMKASKATGEIKDLFDKCAAKINEANAVISKYLSNPQKYVFASTDVNVLLGYLGAYRKEEYSLMNSMQTLIDGQATTLHSGYSFTADDIKNAKENISNLLKVIDARIKSINNNIKIVE